MLGEVAGESLNAHAGERKGGGREGKEEVGRGEGSSRSEFAPLQGRSYMHRYEFVTPP